MDNFTDTETEAIVDAYNRGTDVERVAGWFDAEGMTDHANTVRAIFSDRET